MKILVYGAGVLGSVHAAQLKELGQNVSIPARSRRLADIRHYGIELENSTTGRRTITPSRRGDIHAGRCLLRIEQIARAFHEVVFPTVIRSNMDA